jgi:hypothetical protein
MGTAQYYYLRRPSTGRSTTTAFSLGYAQVVRNGKMFCSTPIPSVSYEL